MKQADTISKKIHQLFILLFPILITQLGMFAMNFFDTTMSGNAGANDLAGVAIGSSFWAPISTGISGILIAITPMVAQQIGAKETSKISFTVTQAAYLSLLLALVVLVLGIFFLDNIIQNMSLTHEVAYIATHFLIGIGFGVIPFFIYTAMRCFIDALGKTRVTMIITLISLPVNIFLNYILIFGKFGFPKLGGIGTGYATAITYWFLLVFSIFIVTKQKPFRQFQLFRNWFKISFSAWKSILKIGVPIGFALFVEMSIFAAVTLLMSNYNTVTIASHQAAMNFASFIYMLPLSISMALTIVVGHEVGAKRFQDARLYSYLGLGLSICLALCTSILLYFFREQVADLYTNDLEVLQLTTQFLMLAILFQFSDAFGAPLQGALRGYKDVNATFIMALVSYWVIGLPIGYALANYTSLQAFGYWIGLIIGLAVGATALLFRLFYVQKRKFGSESHSANIS